MCLKFQTYWNSIKRYCQTIIDAQVSVTAFLTLFGTEHSKFPEKKKKNKSKKKKIIGSPDFSYYTLIK